MRRIVIAASAVAALALAPAALASGTLTGKYKAKIPATVAGGAVTGTWTLDFKHGSVVITDNGTTIGHSSDSFKGSKLRIGPGASCPGSGTYKFNLNDKKLRFTVIKDACDARKAVLSVTYKKIV
ncbi:MAG: hypothetical protein ACRDPA_10160 [Solirubrobacteraceae bacterium]